MKVKCEVFMEMVHKVEILLGITKSIQVQLVKLSKNTIAAYFNVSARRIDVNVKWIQKASINEIIIVAVHEVRHCYQFLACFDCDFSHSENQVTIDAWRLEFNNYVQPKSENQIDYDYLNQLIEIDAIAFTYNICGPISI